MLGSTSKTFDRNEKYHELQGEAPEYKQEKSELSQILNPDSSVLEQETSNFRIFYSIDHYSCRSIVDELEGNKFVVFQMISLFNHFFSDQAIVTHMMRETDKFFTDIVKPLPIFYLNSALLERVTKNLKSKQSKNKKSDIVANAEKKWLHKFDQAEKHLQSEQTRSPHEILSWETFLTADEYDPIYRFVSMFLIPSSSCRLLYPSITDEILSKINADIALLSVHRESSVEVFIQNNHRSFSEIQSPNSESEQHNTYLLPLYEYLAQEMTVFLMLGRLSTLQAVKSFFSLSIPVSQNSINPITPVLCYPISASRNNLAEKTLSVFVQIQDLYEKYSEILGLPSTSSKLILADSFIPERLLKSKKDKDSSKSGLIKDLKKDSDGNNIQGYQPRFIPLDNKNLNETFKPNHSSFFTSSIEEDFNKKCQKFVREHDSKNLLSIQLSYSRLLFSIEVSPLDGFSSENKEEVLDVIKDWVSGVICEDSFERSITIKFQSSAFQYTVTVARPLMPEMNFSGK